LASSLIFRFSGFLVECRFPISSCHAFIYNYILDTSIMVLVRIAAVALVAAQVSIQTYGFVPVPGRTIPSLAFVSSTTRDSRPSPVTSTTIHSAAASPSSFDFDVAIIGCGVGGHGAALHARGQSLTTAVFSGGDVGGTCVNRGCVPSKALLAASGRVRDMTNAHHLKDMGIHVEGEVKFDREGIAAHAKNLANRVKGNLESSLVGLGVSVIEGRGILTGNPHEIKDSVSGKVYTAKVSYPSGFVPRCVSMCM
jgi:dihydrolipoamide dehydrogenase